MNDQDNRTDKELDDFLKGESELNKVYAERESLTVPAHLEFVVKQMAKEDISRENISRDDLSSDDRSDSDKSGGSSAEPTATKNRKYFMPLTLAASIVVALTLTVVLYQDQPEQINVAQNPIDHSETIPNDKRPILPAEQYPERQTPAVSESKPVIAIAQQEKTQLPSEPSVQQRIAPAAQVNIANDVKKSKTEKREQLATKLELPKHETTDSKQDSPRFAEQTPNEIPAHIRELLQNTNASDQKLDGMPPDAILKSWQKAQWVEQVKVLSKQGKHELAERYVNVYPDYFPNDSIQYLLRR